MKKLLFIILGMAVATSLVAYFVISKNQKINKTATIASDNIHLYKIANKDFNIYYGYKDKDKLRHLVKFQTKTSSLTMQLLDTSEKMQVSKKTSEINKEETDVIRFTDIYPDTSVYYLLSKSRNKEVIRLESLKSPAKFVYSVVSENLVRKDKSFGRFSLTDMYMEDANKIRSTNVTMDLQFVKKGDKGEDEYTLIVTPDKTWLSDPLRKFPVLLDPSIDWK